MRVILVMVQSLNGKITRGDDTDIYKWTSKEDQKFFFSFLKKHEVIIMGSRTYEAARKNIKLDDKRLRIVLTSTPKRYSSEQELGKIEFTNANPADLLARLETDGYKQVLLVGGGKVNAAFFAQNLVDELYLTIEPVLFGKGKAIIAEKKFNANLKLINLTKLNPKGTLLLHY